MTQGYFFRIKPKRKPWLRRELEWWMNDGCAWWVGGIPRKDRVRLWLHKWKDKILRRERKHSDFIQRTTNDTD